MLKEYIFVYYLLIFCWCLSYIIELVLYHINTKKIPSDYKDRFNYEWATKEKRIEKFVRRSKKQISFGCLNCIMLIFLLFGLMPLLKWFSANVCRINVTIVFYALLSIYAVFVFIRDIPIQKRSLKYKSMLRKYIREQNKK